MNRENRFGVAFLLVMGSSGACPQAVFAQPTPSAPTQTVNQDDADDSGGKHIFGIIPNYRTSPSLTNYKPLTVAEKFTIARQDTFDQGTVALAAAFAGFSQVQNTNESFGQGVKGYAHRLGTSYADYALGNFLTEAIYPSLLHQDPRYFRKGHGSGFSRVGYSFAQIVTTHGDSGRRQFNYSEVLGNSTGVAISMAYYPDNRSAKDAASALGTQLLVDALSNTLKEFWPDLNRKFSHHRKAAAPAGGF